MSRSLDTTRLAVSLARAAVMAAPIVLAFPTHGARAADPDVVAAAPGRIEGADRVVDVGIAATGVVRTVLVSEGDEVAAGQPLATLDCTVLERDLAVKESDLAVDEASLVRLRNGARPDELSASAEGLKASEARAAQAVAARKRLRSLSGTVSGAIVQEGDRDADVAVALLAQARHQHAMLVEGARKDAIAEAEARVAATGARLSMAKSVVDQCTLRAPSAGVVLSVDVLPGNYVGPMFAKPLVRLADASVSRVRAEVDEYDLSKVCVGQSATLVSDSYPGESFPAVVTKANPGMGRRTVLSGDPAEKSDKDVREVMLRVDGDPEWPIGLRVAVLFAAKTDGCPAKSGDLTASVPKTDGGS